MTARATEAFQFSAASYLVRLGNQAAVNLGELQQTLGENGYKHVPEHFPIASDVRRHLTLFLPFLP